MKMTEAAKTGLVGRIMEALADLPAQPAVADLGRAFAGTRDQPSAAERRARLALRIALMKRGAFTAPAANPEEPLPEIEEPDAQPEPEPVAEPEPPPFIPALPPKPARVSMSTVRLEDAASLLSAFATSPDPDGSVENIAAPPNVEAAPVSSAVVDVGGLAATFAAMAPPAQEPESPEIEAPPPPPTPKAKRKSSPAVPDLAAAAAQLAALQGSGEETPDDTPPAGPDDK